MSVQMIFLICLVITHMAPKRIIFETNKPKVFRTVKAYKLNDVQRKDFFFK